MNLRRVSVFVRVVEEGSFSAAARALGVPKSAVSQAVAALERELGVRLLNRSSRATTVTEAGGKLHLRAAPALRSLDEASVEVTDTHGPLRGVIRLTAPVEVGARLLEPTLSQFQVQHSQVRLELVLTTQVLDFAENGIDIAVRGGPVRDESLVARKLGIVPAGLFASPQYLGRRGTPRRPNDLPEHDCIVHRPAGGRGRWKLTGATGSRTIDVVARLGVDQYAYALRAACSGVGIALLPLFLCQAEISAGTLTRVLPAFSLPDRMLWLVYPSGRYLSRPAAALRDALLAAQKRLRFS